MNQAETILRALRGWNNIVALKACITCIRVGVGDDEAVDERSLRDTGVLGVAAVDKSIQVVIGPETEATVNTIEAFR